MKTSKLITASLAIAFCAVVYTGCKKDDTPVPINSESYSEKTTMGVDDLTAADEMFNGALDIMSGSLPELANIEPNSTTPWKSSCAEVIVNMMVVPHTAEINFGSGCVGNDGNLRSGKIVIVWEGEYSEKGSYYILSFENYALNHNAIEGNAKMVNTGINRLGNIEFRVDATGRITVPPIEPAQSTKLNSAQRNGEHKMTYTFQGTREWISGMATIRDWKDDVYAIRGSFSGTTLFDAPYRAEIKTPLRNELDYPYYTRGVLSLMVSNTLKVVDYGYPNGARDDLASVTIGDVVMFIHLDRNPIMIVNTRY